MPNVSILKASTIVEPDETYFLPLAKVADKGAYKANMPLPADTVPLMNGEAGVGTSKTWARADHVHPTNTAMLETMKTYVDEQNSALQEQISSLAQNLRFVGQADVVADSVKFTSGSGITPSPGPLPAAAPEFIGFYVIVVVAGTPPAGNMPADNYAMHDWIVCDGVSWQRLDVGATASTASTTAVMPPIDGMDDVQEVLETLYNAMPLPSDTVPLMDGLGAVGTAIEFSREDHKHPTDTSRYAASNPAGYVDPAGAAAAAPVQSVAGRSGAVTLTHTDITDWTATLAAYYPATNPAGYITSAGVPVAASTTPVMAGVGAVGTANTWARADHRHPSDTAARKGVTDGSNAAAGDIGEFLSASVQVGGAIAAATGVAIDITTMVLTPGDWDLLGQVGTQAAAGGHIQHMQVWMGTAPATPPTVFAGAFHEVGGIATGGSEQMVLPTGRLRMNVTANTTIYLTTRITFTGACSCYGFMSARRVR